MRKDEKTGYYINEVNGRKYAYIQKSHVWNKEKKQAETSLEYVGRLDESGRLVPKRRHLVKAEISEDTKLSIVDQDRVGMVRVLWQIATDIKLVETLKNMGHNTLALVLLCLIRQECRLSVLFLAGGS